MKRSLPSVVLPIVALLCVGLFLQGCYLCPYEDLPYEFALFNSFKIGQQIRKNTWVLLGTHHFAQNVQYEGGKVKLESAVHRQTARALRATLRVNHFRGQNQLMNRWNFRAQWKKNGNLKKPIQKNVPISFFAMNDRLEWWVKFNQNVSQGTQFASDFIMTF